MTPFPYRVRVALAVHIFDLIDYEIMAEDFARAEIGARVVVPFRQQEFIGVIVEKFDGYSEFKASFQLKKIVKLFDEPALLDQSLLHLLRWAAQYYQAAVGEVIVAALPTLLKQGRPYELLTIHWQVIEPALLDVNDALKRASKQLEAYRILQLHSHGTTETILNMSGVSTKTLKILEQKNLIRKDVRAIDFTAKPFQLAQMPLQANDEQNFAIMSIRQKLGQYQAFLLDGVTGSGKTEVYLQVIESVLQQQQQVLVLVPEIGLTPQTVERFKARFHVDIVLLHSALSDVQRLQAWQYAQTGKASIILGTRLAVFCPLPRLGLIILDEEHDSSFKQQDSFRYHARDVAMYRAYQQQCPIILGSATPSFESLALVEQQKIQHLILKQRAGLAKLPTFQLIDLKLVEQTQGLAKPLIEAIRQHLQQQRQVLIFINRRGYAPVLMCETCHWQADCPHCDAHLTLHYYPKPALRCHHCGYQQMVPVHCPACQSMTLKPIGMATARLEETLRQLFPTTKILRVDRDTTNINSWQKIYNHAQQPEAMIFLGTQMLAKGHHFPHVSLVTILDIDHGLLSSDFRATERMAQLIMQVAGRSGRGRLAGQVLLQTLRPEHPLLQCLIQHGYAAFAQQALKERKTIPLPPYSYAVLLRAESKDMDYNLEFLQFAIQQWSKFGDCQIKTWGPIEAPMVKKAGFFRCNILLFSTSRANLQRQLPSWWQWLFKQPRKHQLRITLDVDPIEIC